MYKRTCPHCGGDVWHTLLLNRKRFEGKPCQRCKSKLLREAKPQYQNVCIDCGNVVPIKYASRVKKNWKCERCRHLVKKRCVVCRTPFSTRKWDDGETCSDRCKFIFIARRLGGDDVENVSQLPLLNKNKGRKLSLSHANVSGPNNPMFGKKHRPSTLKKIRTKATQRMRAKGVRPGYNPRACEAIDAYGKQHGYTFQHALRGGEFYIKGLGYWVDGYDKSKNVVVEYDEPHHGRPAQRKKDQLREQEIVDHLGCKFIRIQEHANN